MRGFVERVAAAISAHGMIAPGEVVLVALSGGADSTALLHALAQLRGRLGFQLCACHVHHGLRGAEADADADHAAAQAAGCGIPFRPEKVDVRGHARASKLSLEAAGRELRYRLLAQAADGMGASRIATGHTADDQAETVLLNLLRGAGPAGLAGMAPVRGRLIRPLLGVSRAEVEGYCRAEGLSYRLDRSNLDRRYTRNRIRHDLMPMLQQIQPNVVAALCRLAEVMRGENEYLSQQAAQALKSCIRTPLGTADSRCIGSDTARTRVVLGALTEMAGRQGEAIALSLDGLAGLPLAVARRVLRAAVARAKGDERDLGLERVEALVTLARAGRTGSVVELSGGWRAERTYGRVVIAPASPRSPGPADEWDLPVPGRLVIANLGVTLTAELSEEVTLSADRDLAVLDADQTGTDLFVRTWRHGDRFLPLGMQSWCKLQDFFTEAKVPRARRAWTPLVVSRESREIVWVAGLRIGERYKVTERTRRTLRLQVQWRAATGGG